MRALALFSGGLDSCLAIKVIQEQGIEVIALNFDSYFFGGSNERAEKMAKQLGVKLEYIDFRERHKEIVENPPSGYGKNMNPCIDCHALMLRIAGELMEKYQADFIITGEVLGQRPMSQNSQSLKRVEKLSGMKGLVIRPLSAKLMEPSNLEKKGLVDREKLLDIQGRGRGRQLELVKKYDISGFESPGGGCLLTEPNYSKKLKLLKEDENFNKEFLFELLKAGRFYRLDKGKYIIIGRNSEGNEILKKYKEKCDLVIFGNKTPGPVILGVGELDKKDLDFAIKLFARYSKTKGEEKSYLFVNDKAEELEKIDRGELEKDIEKYLIK
ncbi:MAG: tRNA (5-methylaminomethyl-2-thiouridylate)-methyltransferase [Fusobacteriia bacterium 4572_132]|nr:MAG: tRNA (5-methylaminomethyl-2-thiouridylate)-methyltransferase [Fusobacteriia bacterium 4572_132]